MTLTKMPLCNDIKKNGTLQAGERQVWRVRDPLRVERKPGQAQTSKPHRTGNHGRLQGVVTGALSPLNFKSCTSGVFLGVWVLFKWVLEPLPPSRNPTKLTIILFVIRSSIVNITLCLYIALVSLGHSLNTLPDWSGIISSVIERTWKRTVINIEQILSCHLCYFGQTHQLTYVLPVLPRLEWLL